jgi:hypothetical protein
MENSWSRMFLLIRIKVGGLHCPPCSAIEMAREVPDLGDAVDIYAEDVSAKGLKC